MIFGTFGFSAFEAGKRFVQAQGFFNAPLFVLLICGPLNVLLHWLFVWVTYPPLFSRTWDHHNQESFRD